MAVVATPIVNAQQMRATTEETIAAAIAKAERAHRFGYDRDQLANKLDQCSRIGARQKAGG
jgi:hypothetical protein